MPGAHDELVVTLLAIQQKLVDVRPRVGDAHPVDGGVIGRGANSRAGSLPKVGLRGFAACLPLVGVRLMGLFWRTNVVLPTPSEVESPASLPLHARWAPAP